MSYVITYKGHPALTLNILLEKLYINFVSTIEAEWSNSCQSFDANWHVNMKASAAELNVPLSICFSCVHRNLHAFANQHRQLWEIVWRMNIAKSIFQLNFFID